MFVFVKSKSGSVNARGEHLLKLQFKVSLSKVNVLHPSFRHSLLQLKTPSTPSDPVAFPTALQLPFALVNGPCQTPTPIHDKGIYT